MNLVTIYDRNAEVLFNGCQPVTDIRAQVSPHVAAMRSLMERKGAVGIAAPQVGVPFRFFLFGGKKLKSRIVVTVINPEIIWTSKEESELSEGCLSFPGRTVLVKRPIAATVRFASLGGQTLDLHADGIEAVVIQHEIDHLNGICIFRRELNATHRIPVKISSDSVK